MKAYWRECGYRHGNFGDNLTPIILEKITRKKIGRADNIEQADIISIGSILHEVGKNYGGVIWGTGAMFEHNRGTLDNANVMAVRGKLSAERYELDELNEVALGDPALLAYHIIEPDITAYDLAIVPHYVDYNSTVLTEFIKHNPRVKIIDPCQPARSVLREISMSRTLLSSSLHALICADSLNIQNAWIKLSDLVVGDGFKFRDYYSVFGITDPQPMMFNESSKTTEIINKIYDNWRRPRMEAIQQELEQALKI